ncbi:Metal transporter CNNM4 [Dirofilaria immitis]|nr:Metal transporter CNNM4 [Dirofilaria immitis]
MLLLHTCILAYLHHFFQMTATITERAGRSFETTTLRKSILIFRRNLVYAVDLRSVPIDLEELRSEVKVEFITYEMRPYVSGIRVVNIPSKSSLISYSESGATIIYPDSRARIVMFGYHLDKIDIISLTTDNCFNSVVNISRPEFIIQTVKRLDFVAYFAESDEPYHICYKVRMSKEANEEEEDMIMMDESRNSIVTETPTRIYYLPVYLQISIIFVLFCLSALFSGLNLGLMALSPQELMLIQKCGSKTERKYAETILPVRQSGNYLLCTILIMNVVVNAAISILFEDMTSGMVAFIVSSVGIVVIGEIIPQSICVKKGLAVGAYTIWLTRTFMILTFPFSYPISKILDVFLGEDTPVYDRCKLINLMKMTACEENQELAADLKIAVGAMEISEKTVGDILTKIEDVFMLPEDMVIDAATIVEIMRCGYSRIPIYADDDRNNVKALLMVKDLALIDPRDNFTVKTGNYHLAIVESMHNIYDRKISRQTRNLLGIVTLEDIVEEILQAEIIDESDSVTDNTYRSRRKHMKEPGFTKLLTSEEYSKELSVHMEQMTIHFLQQHHVIFSGEYVEPRALAHLLKRSIRQIDMSYSPRIIGYSVKQRDTVPIYCMNEPAFRFVMEFEAGPWTSFGNEILDQLDEFVSGNLRNNEDDFSLSDSKSQLIHSIQFNPDFDLFVTDFCRFLHLTVSAYLNAIKVTKIARAARNKQDSIGSLLKTSLCSGNSIQSGCLSEILTKRESSKLSFDDVNNPKECL